MQCLYMSGVTFKLIGYIAGTRELPLLSAAYRGGWRLVAHLISVPPRARVSTSPNREPRIET